MDHYRQWTDPILSDKLQELDADSSESLNIRLGLLPVDSGQLPFLKSRLLSAEPEQVSTLVSLLHQHREALVPDLWNIVDNPTEDQESQLMQAASTLAAYDKENQTQWNNAAERIVDALVRANPLHAAVWVATLKPVKQHLVAPLAVVYRIRNGDRSQREIDLATNVLATFTADDIDTMAELVFDAQPNQFTTLQENFASWGGDAVAKIDAELERQVTFDWADLPLDPEWGKLDTALTSAIESADGIVNQRFVFCQTLPLNEFTRVAGALDNAGYRPIRVRPFAHDDEILVSAAWNRDGRNWRCEFGLLTEMVELRDEAQRAAGFIAVDVAGYLGKNGGQPAEIYAVLWKQRGSDTEDARIYTGVSSLDHAVVDEELKQQGFKFPSSLQVFRGLESQQKCSGVNTKAEDKGSLIAWDQSPAAFSEKCYFDKILWDLDCTTAADPEIRYASLWNASPQYESIECVGSTPDLHRNQCQALQDQGYRIASLRAASVDGEIVTASVWRRPLIPDQEREDLARRQANAAIAAFQMGKFEQLWPRLKHRPDPRLRTWLINRFNALGAPLKPVVDRLSSESDVTIREALILILGEAPPSAKFDREAIAAQLINWYEHDADPGIHGATEWVLRRWGRENDLTTVDDKLSTGVAEGNREWFVTKTKTNQHTFALLPGPVEFMMGSPSDAPSRDQNESRHRVRIDRRVAMATTEVTVQQFQEFLRSTPGINHSYDKEKSPETTCPQTSVIWFEAAAYCRWLSEQEDIPEDQMCYPPINEIKLGMKLPADYLSRTGYRLPSEAEWEYACRAQTITERYYGQADELLVEYGASKDKTKPVGMVKPNRFGLFDMLGNVWEWCQDPSGGYDNQSGTVTLDREFDTPCEDQFSRIFRGGSFDNPPGYFRSAFRPNDKPANRNNYMGFRPCRTYPENR